MLQCMSPDLADFVAKVVDGSRVLGLDVPDKLLALADEVIE